jgi:hypothetical protein
MDQDHLSLPLSPRFFPVSYYYCQGFGREWGLRHREAEPNAENATLEEMRTPPAVSSAIPGFGLGQVGRRLISINLPGKYRQTSQGGAEVQLNAKRALYVISIFRIAFGCEFRERRIAGLGNGRERSRNNAFSAGNDEQPVAGNDTCVI